ncbi:unnamed protein product [Cochlearia groenlandica]
MGRTFSYSLSDPDEAPGFGGYENEDEDEVISHFRIRDVPSELGHTKVCFCGSDVIVEASKTRANPGRLYYTCAKRDSATDYRGCHIWKWWDEALMEELTEARRKLALEHGGLQDKIEELASLKNLIKETTNHTDELKNMTQKLFIGLMTSVVVFLAIYIFK